MNPSRRRALQFFGVAGFALLTGKTAWLQAVDGPALAAQAKAAVEKKAAQAKVAA